MFDLKLKYNEIKLKIAELEIVSDGFFCYTITRSEQNRDAHLENYIVQKTKKTRFF